MRLSDRQIERYSRQILLREVGGTGQKALLAARVLIVGSGAALETALTYLAGAGIGILDVLRDAASGAASELPFAPIRDRNAEVQLGEPERASVVAGDYDLLVVLRGGPASASAAALPPGRPRAGEIALQADAGGRLALTIVPDGAGCVACRTPASEGGSAKPGAPDVGASASAGALAALVVCRWLLGLPDAAAPRALLLDETGVTWTDGPLAARTPCPRGCPPVAHPV